MNKKLFWIVYLIVISFLFVSCRETNNESEEDLKPVIYLYPEETLEVEVELIYDGTFTCTYPEYNGGWNVTAYPDGSIIDATDGKEYSYLFWEGISDYDWQISKGFVVSGEETAEFLQEKLSYIGLTPEEYNEFIVFWLPHLQDSNYNLIYFAEDDYEELAELSVLPKPDNIIRVFMVYQELDRPIDIEEQKLQAKQRNGFTVVEWGGTKVN